MCLLAVAVIPRCSPVVLAHLWHDVVALITRAVGLRGFPL